MGIDTFRYVLDFDLSFNQLELNESLISALKKLKYLRALDLRGNTFYKDFASLAEPILALDQECPQEFSDFEGYVGIFFICSSLKKICDSSFLNQFF
jgi:hypothetical protein